MFAFVWHPTGQQSLPAHYKEKQGFAVTWHY